MRQGTAPIGSRRRRAALQTAGGLPFEQLPYQCFQEARKVLLADRAQKLEEIESMRQKIARVQAQPVEQAGGEVSRKSRVTAMQQHLEKLKILADINDPLVKRKFEDGQGMLNQQVRVDTRRTGTNALPYPGDMSKPIYRFLADRKWREYRRKILVQRITQMNVVPDVLPQCDPVVETKLYFGKRQIQPGDFVLAKDSATAPKLDVQMFESGEKLVTIAVVDPDVPNVEADSFDFKMHYLAVNVPISAISTKVDLSQLSTDSQVVLPWAAPVSQKGSPYHRLSVFIMEQKDSQPLDFAAVKAKETERENMLMRTLQARYHLKAIGAHLFRSQWDATTLQVMKQIGFSDADVELRRKKVEPLPYKRRNPSSFR
jgi:large subunit ribosomal protein L35